MDVGQRQLRDRMLRDAIVEVLRSTFDTSGQGDAISLVDGGFIGQIVVVGGRVRVDVALPKQRVSFAGSLASEVQRCVEALPEVTRAEVSVRVGEERTNTGLPQSTCQ